MTQKKIFSSKFQFLICGVRLKKFPLGKIVGPPWKEGEIRLGVNKVSFTMNNPKLSQNSKFILSFLRKD